jgi:hypothetical protein
VPDVVPAISLFSENAADVRKGGVLAAGEKKGILEPGIPIPSYKL